LPKYFFAASSVISKAFLSEILFEPATRGKLNKSKNSGSVKDACSAKDSFLSSFTFNPLLS
jgi:hypothetical protein